MNNKQKIRAEVVRLKETVGAGLSAYDMGKENGAFDAYEKVLKFIDSLPEEPVSEELEKELNNWRHKHFDGKRDFDASGEYLERVSQLDLARHMANWQKERMEKERLAHCDSLTKEQYELESNFVAKHFEINNRIPTFIDAIEFGMRLKKEQMIIGACCWLEDMVLDFRKAMEDGQ